MGHRHSERRKRCTSSSNGGTVGCSAATSTATLSTTGVVSAARTAGSHYGLVRSVTPGHDQQDTTAIPGSASNSLREGTLSFSSASEGPSSQPATTAPAGPQTLGSCSRRVFVPGWSLEAGISARALA